jgi:midasin
VRLHPLPVQEVQAKVLRAMAGLLALPSTAADHLLSADKPALKITPTAVSIGRASLPREAQTASLHALASAVADAGAAAMVHSGRGGSFAHTGHAARLMQSVAAAVAACEPLLLVGESGTGKTALIQHLAKQVCWLFGAASAVSWAGVVVGAQSVQPQ